MEFKERYYPVDKQIFERLMQKHGTVSSRASIEMGYSKGTISAALFAGHISRKMAAALYRTYGIAPNDYAPKTQVVQKDEPKPETTTAVMTYGAARTRPIDAALLPDGVYCLEFVDVRNGRKTGDKPEGYKFVTIATGNNMRVPYYFALYNREAGGEIVNELGEEWIRHLLRVTLGNDYREDSDVREIVGRRCWAYLMIYDNKNGKRYNRTVWVEPMGTTDYGEPEQTEPLTWRDFLNAEADDETLIDALQYIAGELGLRRHTITAAS